MTELSDDGRRIVGDLAGRHGFGEDAVRHALAALAAGQGTQAQFNHPELGGMGQWSQGGMTMIGDMFNNALKARVDALCTDLAAALRDTAAFAPPRAVQSQSQGGLGVTSLFVSGTAPGSDWPATLGRPASQGAQNDMRYAYFPGSHRLWLSVRGKTSLHDTGDHRITGFGQAQSGDQSLTLTSQHGLVRIADLPLISEAAPEATAPAPPAAPAAAEAPPSAPAAAEAPPSAAAEARPSAPAAPAPPAPAADPGLSDEQIFARLERLADFHARGILSDDEFATKKAELLARL